MTSAAHLFQPRAAYRFRPITPPAVPYDDPTQGEDPRYGASLNYWLKAPARTAPTVTILDAAGGAVRTLRGTNNGPPAHGQRPGWHPVRGQAPAEARLPGERAGRQRFPSHRPAGRSPRDPGGTARGAAACGGHASRERAGRAERDAAREGTDHHRGRREESGCRGQRQRCPQLPWPQCARTSSCSTSRYCGCVTLPAPPGAVLCATTRSSSGSIEMCCPTAPRPV